MIANRNYEHCEPLTWVGRVPVYLATALAALHGVTLILSALAMAVGAEWFFRAFVFSSGQVLGDWKVWQFVTYAFVSTHPNEFIWTVIQLFLLAIFGREVEKHIGRRSFAWLYGALLLAAPVYFLLLSFGGTSFVYAGSGTLHFAVFIAFVVIYPGAEIFFGLQARWLAAILLGVNSLQLLAGQQPAQLGLLWLECGLAALWLVKDGVREFSLPSPAALIKARHSARRLRVVPKESVEEPELHETIDPILEKIARQGIGSLTRAEREKLERARAVLLEKERRN